MNGKIRVNVWNEYTQAHKEPRIANVYPNGLHSTIAGFLNKDPDIAARTSLLTDPEQGLSEEILNNIDVLIWWAHGHHKDVEDRFAQRVVDHVRRGMGIIFLHSAHRAKPFMSLLGTSGRLGWREAEERCRVWAVNPDHPIAAGIPEQFVIDQEEMYSEPFGIPEPGSTVFISWYQGGNVFRSGVAYQREYGKIFYFQPGHETYPVYYNENVQKVISNAVKWAYSERKAPNLDCYEMEALEKIQ